MPVVELASLPGSPGAEFHSARGHVKLIDSAPPPQNTLSMVEQKPIHVIVLGAGFGGLTFCQHFHHSKAGVTVVDRTNHHLFQPLLYQVAAAGLSAPDIAQPIRSILSRRLDITVLLDEVVDFDLA